ncbi:MAG: 3-methyl-2-oxobutanoate hydroxymethyltransferase [Actinomycetota bacterium]|jgi:3-methyl-2-oxobutanoate hydroxymethyltransferase|nr:3-methyl-2-oxobutanoate hydroxymethyltransferase [Actinomycetota bacterium]
MFRHVSVNDLLEYKKQSKKWLMLTSYDSLTSSLFDELEIPVILVGDSAAQLVFGHDSTVPVTMEEMLPIVGGVARANKHSLIIADMPFGSYQSSITLAIENATKFLKAGAHAVKLEGGQRISNTISSLVEAGIPVMGHIGLTPQSVNVFGGYKVQGKGEQAQSLLQDAKAVEASGAFSVVLEAIPRNLAKDITNSISIPTIGIGAGPDTDAQVLVWQDLAGLTKDPVPKFVKRYANLRKELSKAIMEVKNEVESGKYPDEKHLYQ